ncbi:MAG: hypothetical protein A2Y79_04130 [Deltaproteobacteria bacterium RBG_13_43_22]|nr:MAG: hypothetical protein A2Y79_04130 [Deltaproteobacteria bacterium RBG_13_43_22]
MKRIRPNGFRLIVGSLALFFIFGCGYGFRGTVNNLPPDIQSIYIPVFTNETIESGAEVVFANALIYEFTRSRILKVVSESEAQAYISGKIKSIAVDSVTYASTSQAVERKATVTLEISCRRSDNQTILWQNQSLSRYENYKVTSDTNQTQRNKEEAIKKIAQDLSERIHNGILENF